MKHRSVVANFIFRWSDSGRTQQQVALFRRSKHPNIRSYQGKYAPISGSIESRDTSPELAAEREISEETQLVAGVDVFLEFCGKPYSFEDKHAGRSWTVHPFGWTLEVEDSKIKIDWEHDSWAWFDPQVILDGSMSEQCVPKLDKSLQRIYFGPNGMFGGGGDLVGRSNYAGITFLQTVHRLKNDIDNGARVLALEALKGLHSIAESFKAGPSESEKLSGSWYALVTAGYHFIYSARASMSAAIRTTLLDALQEVAESFDGDLLDPAIACRVFEAHMSQRKSSDEIAQAFKVYIDQHFQPDVLLSASEDDSQRSQSGTIINIITLSQSSTVLAALLHVLTDQKSPITGLNLTILESRPRCEGASLASSLIGALQSSSSQLPHLDIRIIPESHTAHILSTVSANTIQYPPQPALIVLGADRIDPHGNIINKTGSRVLGVLAKTLTPNTTRTIVLSESAKISSFDPSDPESLQSPFRDNINTQEIAPAMSDPTPLLIEAHPAQEVYGSWSKETQDQLRPYLHRGQGDDCDTVISPNLDINVTIDNMYFEVVASSLIDVFITEYGVTSREDIMRISVKRQELENRIFKED